MIEAKLKETKDSSPKDDDLVCYCFKYTRADIENDWRENGRSLIYRRISAARKSGGCNCAAVNPKGI
jgi:hypothetical protein